MSFENHLLSTSSHRNEKIRKSYLKRRMQMYFWLFDHESATYLREQTAREYRQQLRITEAGVLKRKFLRTAGRLQF